MPPSPKGVMDWRGRVETMVSLAMLPLGVAMAFVSTVAFISVLMLLLVSFAFSYNQNWVWYALWAAPASVVAARNIVGSIKTLNGLDWRAFALTLLWSGVALAIYPGLWGVSWS